MNRRAVSPKDIKAIIKDVRVHAAIAVDYNISSAYVGKIKRQAGVRAPRHGEIKRGIDGRRLPSAEYRAWQNMRNRVLNPNAEDYAYYGGRGIKITPRWDLFVNFLEDMGRRPTPLHTVDRKNVNGNYCKANCRWATREQQSQNRTDTRFSREKVKKIRELYATGSYRQIDLARMYGSTQAAISQITRNVAWKAPRTGGGSCAQ